MPEGLGWPRQRMTAMLPIVLMMQKFYWSDQNARKLRWRQLPLRICETSWGTFTCFAARRPGRRAKLTRSSPVSRPQSQRSAGTANVGLANCPLVAITFYNNTLNPSESALAAKRSGTSTAPLLRTQTSDVGFRGQGLGLRGLGLKSGLA